MLILCCYLIFWDKYEKYDNDSYSPLTTDNVAIWDLLAPSSYTYDCYNKSLDKCLKYSNCGICYDNKNKQEKCVPGDYIGPFFKTGCDQWIYSNKNEISHSFDYKLPYYEHINPPTNFIGV